MKTLQTETLTAEQVEQYKKDGYLIVHDLLSDEQIEAFLAYEKLPKKEGWRQDLRNHASDDVWRAMTTNPRMVAAVEQLAEGECVIVQSMFLEKHPARPGEKPGTGVAMHQDLHYLPCEPQSLLACWVALSDTDGDNGGLCVVPGSHIGSMHSTHKAEDTSNHDSWEIVYDMKDPSGKTWQETMYSFEIDGLKDEDIVRLTVPRGAGVIFDGKTIHGSFGNHSKDRPRLAFATHFCREGTWMFRSDVHETVPVR